MVMVMVNDVGREPYAHMPICPCAAQVIPPSDGRSDGRSDDPSRSHEAAPLLSVTDHGPSLEGRARESSLDSDNRVGAVGGCAESGSSSPGAPDPRSTGIECECECEWTVLSRAASRGPAMSRDTKQITKKE